MLNLYFTNNAKNNPSPPRPWALLAYSAATVAYIKQPSVISEIRGGTFLRAIWKQWSELPADAHSERPDDLQLITVRGIAEDCLLVGRCLD